VDLFSVTYEEAGQSRRVLLAPMDGWFRREFRTPADLGGAKLRVGGLVGAVLQKRGVVPQMIPGGEIYVALGNGLIDGASWIGPYDDERLGFYKVAPYYYRASFYRAPLSFSLYVNLDAWNRLPADYRSALENACQRATEETQKQYIEANALALSNLGTKGVNLRQFPPTITHALEQDATAYYEETAAKNASFKTLYERWKTYRNRSAGY